MTNAQQYAGIGLPESHRIEAALEGLSDAVALVLSGFAQLGVGRVREGLVAFEQPDPHQDWTDCFLARCDGQPGRLRAHALIHAGFEGRDVVTFLDVARALKVDEASVRVIAYMFDHHPAALYGLAVAHLSLGRAVAARSAALA